MLGMLSVKVHLKAHQGLILFLMAVFFLGVSVEYVRAKDGIADEGEEPKWKTKDDASENLGK
jgi:hypothetical protein